MITPRITDIRHFRAAAALLALIVSATLPSSAQQPSVGEIVQRADSLQNTDAATALSLVRGVLPALHAGTDRALEAKALRIRCWASSEALPDSLSAFATSAFRAAEASTDPRAIAQARVCRGYARESAGDMRSALDDYERGVEEARRLAMRELLAEALVLRGEADYNRGDYRRSVEGLNEAYRLYQQLGNANRIGYTLNAMANLYADPQMGQYDRALEYYRELLTKHVAAGRRRETATAYFNIGSTYERMNRLEDALGAYRRALAMDQTRNDRGEVAADRRAVGVVLYKLGRPAQALRELEPVVAFYEGKKDPDGVARARLSRGVARRMLGRANEAIADLSAAQIYFTSSKNPRFLVKAEEELALAYAAAGNFHAAYDARGRQLALQKSLENAAREEQSARLRVQFASDKKDQENAALARESALRGEALRNSTRIRMLQTAVIALATIVIIALTTFGFRQISASRRLRILAMVDELTQVPNRRAVLQLAEEQARAARAGGPGFALIALDIDHFKRINDESGHEAGDVVLRRVAQLCREALRPGDHVGRVGGEEFVVVLPGATDGAATEVAERLRLAVEQADFGDVADELSVTVSIGAAVWAPDDRSIAELQRRADASLYAAKRSGRNQTLLATRSG